MLSRCLSVALAFLVPSVSWAAMPPNELQPSSRGTRSATFGRVPSKPPPSDDSGLLEILRTRLIGSPVVAVETGDTLGGHDVPPFREDEKLLSRLQDVTEAYSTPQRALVPYAVRGAWVIAPLERDEIVTDFSRVSVVDALGSAALWHAAMLSITPTEISEMAHSDGIAYPALPFSTRDLVRRALAPPLGIETNPAGGPGPELADLPTLDLSKLRIQVSLRTTMPILLIEYGQGNQRANSMVAFREPPESGEPLIHPMRGSDRRLNLPVVRRVSNTFKPSDLHAGTFRRPIGAHGIMSMEDFLQRAEAASGLRLRVSPQYRGVSVFVGSDDVLVGDALDAVRLALTAAWRDMGGFYFLTYERDGFGALMERVRENGADLARAVRVRSDTDKADPSWLEFMLRVPFAPDDPYALTSTQQARLYGPDDPKHPDSSPMIRWQEMTPAQQSAFRADLAGKSIFAPAPDGRSWKDRPATPEDTERAALTGQARIAFRVRIPGVGWASLPEQWGRTISPNDARFFEQRAAAPAPLWPPPDPRSQFMPPGERPVLLPARARAIISPPLAAADIAPLAALMRARGFSTLFYPLLEDGKTLIASTDFPPAPALASGGGFVAVARAMKQQGIRVLGCMDTLRWRKAGETGGLLAAHPAWLDRDILGRPFSEAVRGFSMAEALPNEIAPPAMALGDTVRPGEPEVISRLEGLVREAAALPEVSGILFDDWTASNAIVPPDRRLRLPWYGMTAFAPADRLAAVLKGGVDPVDIPLDPDTDAPIVDTLCMPPSPADPPARIVNGKVVLASPLIAPDRALLNRLAAITPQTRPWVTYAVAADSDTGSVSLYRPTAVAAPLRVKTALIIATPYLRPWPPGADAVFRVTTDGAGSPGTPWRMPSTPAITVAESVLDSIAIRAPLNLAVYDFRQAPDDLMDSLRRVGLPKPVKSR